MREAKAALPFGPTTIIERMITELSPVAAEIIVVAAPATEETFQIRDLLATGVGKILLLRDDLPFAGPIPALVRGLRAACNPIVFVCSCDLPLLQASVVRTLCGFVAEYDVVLPQVGEINQPLCAAYKKDAVEKIEACWQQREGRLTAIVEQMNRRQVTEAEMRIIDPDLRSFLNVNTREDYLHALAVAGLKV